MFVDYCVDIRDNKIQGGLEKKKQEGSEETHNNSDDRD